MPTRGPFMDADDPKVLAGTRVPIAELEELASRHDLQALVVVAVERDGTVTTVTYGEDDAKCKAIADWGQGMTKAGLAIIPFRTVFGWGTNGMPTPLTSDELHQFDLQRLGRVALPPRRDFP